MDKVINGVDVSGCEFSCENPLHEIKHSCNVRGCEKDNVLHIHLKCNNNPDCYYKQLKRLERQYEDVLKLAKENADSNEYCLQELEQENERLKEENYQLQKDCQICENFIDFIPCKPIRDMDYDLQNVISQRDNYYQALQEIKDMIAKPYCCKPQDVIDKINSVMGAE